MKVLNLFLLLKNNYFLVFLFLVNFISCNVKSNEASPFDALSFIINGDFKEPLIENVHFSNCISDVTINALFFGKFTITNDWNKAIWKSKGYRLNENNKLELVIACSGKCSKLESSEGLDSLFAFATLYSGIDYEKNIILEVRPSIQRVDKALNVIKNYCPGKNSLF